MDRDKILKMTVTLALIVVVASSLGRLARRDSMSLAEYASLQGTSSAQPAGDEPSSSNPEAEGTLASSAPSGESDGEGRPSASPVPSGEPAIDSQSASSVPSSSPGPADTVSTLIGASLNAASREQRTTLDDGFYYEPISDALRRYMTGISFPAPEGEGSVPEPEITFEELMYVHILHYDFDGNSTEGELVCNESIAQDLAEIFQELYQNEYRLEKVLLIEEYDGDDTASMEDNNTSCFNYRPVEGSTSLSKHAYGLAIDINPLYNPYITYTAEGSQEVSPVSALPYADRSLSFPYKIDDNDLCYKLFTQHGFTWGGNWNNVKDYQHFQKTR